MSLSNPIVLPEGIEKPLFYSALAPTMPGRSGNLPHWEQLGKTAFVTFRLADSLPADKLISWQSEECEWLVAHPRPWDAEIQQEHDTLFSQRMEMWLDRGYGECLMRDTSIQKLIEDTLRYFDGERYRLYAFVVMPNHVHVCFMPLQGYTLSDIVHTWKSYSAKAVNKALDRAGTVWQKEYFDRYIRNGEHFERVLRYIRRNDPARAWWVAAEV